MKLIGSAQPRLYRLSKIHKISRPPRPILSMTGSPQYLFICLFISAPRGMSRQPIELRRG